MSERLSHLDDAKGVFYPEPDLPSLLDIEAALLNAWMAEHGKEIT